MTNHKKILLVEDDEINAKLVRDFLTYKGYQILVVNNGLEVKGVVDKEKPDLILLDIQIFGKSGIEVAKELKDDMNTSSIPVFAVSAFSKNKVLTNEQSGLFDEYIEKPIRFAEFLPLLDSYLDEERK
jgi:two-component system cell cycle response regulator DivK